MKRLTLVALSLSLLLLTVLTALPADAARLQTSGKLSLLRVHDVGTAYGPPGDAIDVEVIFHFANQPGKAFGFQLRKDTNELAHQGMLDLLRDAFNNNWTVGCDFDINPGQNNGVAMRVWVIK